VDAKSYLLLWRRGLIIWIVFVFFSHFPPIQWTKYSHLISYNILSFYFYNTNQ
jgi:hypothetical protein